MRSGLSCFLLADEAFADDAVFPIFILHPVQGAEIVAFFFAETIAFFKAGYPVTRAVHYGKAGMVVGKFFLLGEVLKEAGLLAGELFPAGYGPCLLMVKLRDGFVVPFTFFEPFQGEFADAWGIGSLHRTEGRGGGHGEFNGMDTGRAFAVHFTEDFRFVLGERFSITAEERSTNGFFRYDDRRARLEQGGDLHDFALIDGKATTRGDARYLLPFAVEPDTSAGLFTQTVRR